MIPTSLPLWNHPMLEPIVALVAGIMILIAPRLLNYVVAFYFIVTGALEITQSPPEQLSLSALIPLIAGVLILLLPRLLNYVVAIALILIGLTGLYG